MKIGIFASVAGRNDSGPETYEVSLIKNLALIDPVNEYHIFCFNKEAVDAIAVTQDNFKFHVLWPSSRAVVMLVSLHIGLYINKVPFFHATFIPPPFAFKPFVMTMHGSDMFEHPEFFKKNVLTRLVALLSAGLKNSSRVICVSHHVKEYISNKFTLPADKFSVIHHGVETGFRPLSDAVVNENLRSRFGLESGYILFVGKLVQGKNIDRLLKAYINFVKRTSADVKLVLAGRSYKGMSDFEDDLNEASIQRKVIKLGHINHSDLPYLYNGALMFVFPSLWEGFGLPLIEAMACEVPIITSNVSCIPEITGNSALLIDPLSIPDIENAMVELYESNELKVQLKHSSLERSKDFTWKKTAQKTLQIYQELM